MVGVGIVGIGFMGMIHYLAAQRARGLKVVAVCSRDAKKLAGDWTDIQGNFGPRGTQMDLSALRGYREFGELLEDPTVDLVDLCVPNDSHAPMAIKALKAGKHVLVEKPIALAPDAADEMVETARATGKLLMVGHVLPFFPEFAFALEAVMSGRYGALQAAHFVRVISKPDWSSGIADAGRSGGPAIDLHIHDSHFVALACGVPRAVHSTGVVQGDAVVHLTTQYLYDRNDFAVSCISGALSQSGRPFTHGYQLYFERATVAFDYASLAGIDQLAPLCVILPDGKVERPTSLGGDPIDSFADELTVAALAVATKQEAVRLSGFLAKQALRICLAEIESVRRQRTIEIA